MQEDLLPHIVSLLSGQGRKWTFCELILVDTNGGCKNWQRQTLRSWGKELASGHSLRICDRKVYAIATSMLSRKQKSNVCGNLC